MPQHTNSSAFVRRLSLPSPLPGSLYAPVPLSSSHCHRSVSCVSFQAFVPSPGSLANTRTAAAAAPTAGRRWRTALPGDEAGKGLRLDMMFGRGRTSPPQLSEEELAGMNKSREEVRCSRFCSVKQQVSPSRQAQMRLQYCCTLFVVIPPPGQCYLLVPATQNMSAALDGTYVQQAQPIVAGVGSSSCERTTYTRAARTHCFFEAAPTGSFVALHNLYTAVHPNACSLTLCAQSLCRLLRTAVRDNALVHSCNDLGSSTENGRLVDWLREPSVYHTYDGNTFFFRLYQPCLLRPATLLCLPLDRRI